MDDLKEFATWKGYPLPALNVDGQFDSEPLHREWVAFRAGLARRAVPQASAEQDALRYKWLADRVLACDYGDNDAPGEQVGWRIRHNLLGNGDRQPAFMYGKSIDEAIDAAIRAASNATSPADAAKRE